MNISPLVDGVSRTAGALAALSFVGVLATVAILGDDDATMTSSPLALAAVVSGLLALIALACAVVSYAARLHGAPSWTGGAVLAAMAGTVLAAGGQWTLLFVVPGLADVAPEIVSSGLASVTVGYTVSFLVLGAGFAALGVAVRRAGLIGRLATGVWMVGALLCIVPLPSRWFVLALAVSWALPRLDPQREQARVTGAVGLA